MVTRTGRAAVTRPNPAYQVIIDGSSCVHYLLTVIVVVGELPHRRPEAGQLRDPIDGGEPPTTLLGRGTGFCRAIGVIADTP